MKLDVLDVCGAQWIATAFRCQLAAGHPGDHYSSDGRAIVHWPRSEEEETLDDSTRG
jgi:hypothetical protein